MLKEVKDLSQLGDRVAVVFANYDSKVYIKNYKKTYIEIIF